MKLFLWGAPCADTAAEQQMLMSRGYETTSLVDIKRQLPLSTPRDLKRHRGLSIIESDAVVVVDHDSQSCVLECAALCRAVGVAMVLSHELPWNAPHELRMQETIDACDVSFRRPRTTLVARAQQRVPPTWREVVRSTIRSIRQNARRITTQPA